jgi:crotonobetainyl-CoA:carnitine CoA-transferase CaiB-like acyl-CoA transferase
MPGAAEELNPAPKRGEHTRQVLTELAGMDESEINALAEAGAFGDVEV